MAGTYDHTKGDHTKAATLDYTTRDFLFLYSSILLYVHIKYSCNLFVPHPNSFCRILILNATTISNSCAYTGKHCHFPSDIDSPTAFYLINLVLLCCLNSYWHGVTFHCSTPSVLLTTVTSAFRLVWASQILCQL